MDIQTNETNKIETPPDKLDLILQKVEKMEKKLNPPFWKLILKWFISNFITLVFLIFIAYAVWRVWNIVLDVKEFTSTLDDTIKTFFMEQFDKLKFWNLINL